MGTKILLVTGEFSNLRTLNEVCKESVRGLKKDRKYDIITQSLNPHISPMQLLSLAPSGTKCAYHALVSDLESADQYVLVPYMVGDKLSKLMLIRKEHLRGIHAEQLNEFMESSCLV